MSSIGQVFLILKHQDLKWKKEIVQNYLLFLMSVPGMATLFNHMHATLELSMLVGTSVQNIFKFLKKVLGWLEVL